MNKKEFSQLFRQLPNLSSDQRRQLLTELQPPDYPEAVRHREQQLLTDRRCIYCGSDGVVRNGKHSELIRFRCRNKECSRTYNALSKTSFSRLQMKEKWDEYCRCLEQKLTLEQAAKQCGISYRTAFNWRHRFLASIKNQEQLKGLMEVDKDFFVKRSKSDHTWNK